MTHGKARRAQPSTSTALVHLSDADLTFAMKVEKQIQRMRDMWREDPLTARTPEFRAGVRSHLELAVEEYDRRLRLRPQREWPLINESGN